MGLIREPKNVDFTVQSQPWTKEELFDFRKLMTELKAKNSVGKSQPKSKKEHSATNIAQLSKPKHRMRFCSFMDLLW
jgi:hypothetical protein